MPNKKDFNKNKTSASSSSTANNNKEEQDDDILVFQDKEKELLNETAKDLNIDLQNDSDLLKVPEDTPDLSEEELDKLIKDKKVKTLVRDIGNNPTIVDTFPENTNTPELTIEEIEQRRQDKVDRRENLVLMLADNDTIKLHLSAGMKDGKQVWIEKEFYFNSYDKRAEFGLNILSARLRGMAAKHTLLMNKNIAELTPGEQNFLMNSQLMIEVAAYRLQEYEVKMKFGMTPQEYARVESKELEIARLAFQEHVANVPSYRQRRPSSGFKGRTGTTLSNQILGQ